MNKTAATKIFNELWTAFDRHYALFEVKGINWKQLGNLYRSKITAEISEKAFFNLCCDMIARLNDNHVRLKDISKEMFRSGLLGEQTEDSVTFSRELINKCFLKGKAKFALDNIFFYGRTANNVGYIHFDRFHCRADTLAAFDIIIKGLSGCRAFIIDVRKNMGGDDIIGKRIADHFADAKRLYMKTSSKIGPERQDFAPARDWYVENRNLKTTGKPVVLLTDRTSVSAAENFALAFKVMPNAAVIGDITSGCYADSFWFKLSNGWETAISFKLFTDGNNVCYEGLGVAPDYRIVNTVDDVKNERDPVLLFALDFLKTAKGTIRENAPEPVKTAAIYSPEDELECIAELIAKGAYKAALERALKGAKVKGSSWLFHFLSARANLKTKNDQNALPLLEKACKLNRSFFPWEKDFNDLICKLTKNGMSEELRSQIISYKPKFFV